MAALISACEKYRYWLSRPAGIEHPTKGAALFIMLNPSTADAELDDRTITRCRGFADLWGCDGLMVANLYALRATNPKDLWTSHDPVGRDNDAWLNGMCETHSDIICAWGNNAKPDRVNGFLKIARARAARLWCFRVTVKGAPYHPLYMPADQPLIEFTGVAT